MSGLCISSEIGCKLSLCVLGVHVELCKVVRKALQYSMVGRRGSKGACGHPRVRENVLVEVLVSLDITLDG